MPGEELILVEHGNAGALRYAIVVAGVVVNVVFWNGGNTWSPPPGSTPVQLAPGQRVSVGDTFDGANFSAGQGPDPEGLEAIAPPFLMLGGAYYPAGLANGTALGTGAPSANVLRLLPLWFSRSTPIDRVGINVTAGAPGNVRLGIYRTDPDAVRTGRILPTKLAAETGNIDTSSNGVKEIAVARTIPSGSLAWLGIVSSAAPTIRTMALGGCWAVLGFDQTMATTPRVGLSIAHNFGPLPATLSNGFTPLTAAPIPAIFVRAAA